MDQGSSSRYQKACIHLTSNPEFAFREFAILADEGNTESMLQLALCYQHGIGTVSDYNLAEIWHRKAYEAGPDDVKKQAEENLFWLRLQKSYALRSEEPIRAFEEFSQLSDEGYSSAMLQLAWCYEKGIGTTSDQSLSEAWYRRAYETGSVRVKEYAIYYLAWLYLREKNFDKAREAFKLGAEMNYAPAIYRLGRIYKCGDGVKKDLVEARTLIERAAKQGHIMAKYDLATLFMSGRFGFINIIKGFILFFRFLKEAVIFVNKGGDLGY